MKGICRLFDTECSLRESHIYPRFVIQYMKKTGSMYLRNFVNPNKREQDGIKKYLLSDRAEQRFGISENWFKKNIFTPYLEQNLTQFEYNNHLFYFSISFLWRILLVKLEDPKLIKQPFYQKLKEIEIDWKHFLRGENHSILFSNVQLFLSSHDYSHNLNIPGMDYYLNRAYDGDVIFTNSGDYLAVYGKFLSFIFWVIIISDEKEICKETIINSRGGSYIVPQRIADKRINEYLIYKLKVLNQLPKPSEHQRKIMIAEYLKNENKISNTNLDISTLYEDNS